MKNISLYEEIFDKVEAQQKSLGGDANDDVLSKMSLKFDSKVSSLEQMCYLMEATLLRKPTEATVYAGFQKVSRAEAIWDRYHELADNVDKVYLFGEKDKELEPHENIEFVYLPANHKLIREWFLVIDKKIGSNMMVAYDEDGFGVEDLKEDRNFKGVKTSRPEHIEKAVNLLEEIV